MTRSYSNSELQSYKITGRHDLSLEQRLSLQIVIVDSGCWIWQGGTTGEKSGYGRVRVNGEKTLAHRASFELFVRRVPDGLTLDHLCRTRLCINPFHLVPKSQHENILAGKGRMAQLAISPTCRNGHEFSFEFYTSKGRRLFRRFCLACRTAYRQRKAATNA